MGVIRADESSGETESPAFKSFENVPADGHHGCQLEETKTAPLEARRTTAAITA